MCVYVCVCVCVCVCMCSVCVCVGMHVCVYDVYQSHSPQTFTGGNDSERVPNPNWVTGTLHTSSVIASTALLLILTIRED